ncbi:MAG: RagB/SusD family nutrient uptake outer membrane protein [Saprospiraceae bacterium]
MKNFILIIFLAFTCSNCSDFLDKEPISDLAEDNFFKTGVDAESALVAAYDALQSEYYIFDRFTNGDAIADNCYAGGDNPNNFQLDEFTVTTTNVNVERDWAFLYEGISRANAVLDNVPNIEATDITEERITEMLAEASFLRAYHYFQLVNLWGDVPLVLEKVSSTDPEVVFQPKVSTTEIYEAIISDLEFAVENLPASFDPSQERATKGAANAMLAKAYAHQPNPNWEMVKQHSSEVISSGTYQLVSNYNDLWNPANENSSESIFFFFFIGGTNEANWGPQLWLPPSITQDGWRKFNTPSNDLIEAFDSENDNVRKNASIIFEGGLSWQDPDYPSGTIPFPFKQREANGWSSSNNYLLIRLADVILLLAEAENELGNTAGASTALNQIRNRVNLPNTTAAGQAELRTAIQKERRLELAFEGHRWFDLKRTGRAVSVMNALGRNYNVEDFELWWPVPQSELDRNPKLTQNEGY